MRHQTTFVAAYTLLLSRLWQELESILTLLPAMTGASAQRLEIQLEILRLELLSLRHLLAGSRLPLDIDERRRVGMLIDQLLGTLEPMSVSAGTIEAAQDLVFDEVQHLLVSDPPHVPSAAEEPRVRHVA